MRRLLILMVLILGFSFGLSSQNAQEIIPVQSNAYDRLDSILREVGMTAGSTVRPYTKAQFLHMLKWVNREELSDAGKKSWDSILKTLDGTGVYREGDKFTIDAGLASGIEINGRTDSTAPYLFNDYWKRLPMLSIPIGISALDVLSLSVDFDVREEYFATSRDKPGFGWINIPGDIGYIDLEIPLYANGTVGTDNINFTIGHNKLSVGPGKFSNMIISDTADFLNYAMFKTYWDLFSYSMTVIALEPELTDVQKASSENAGAGIYQTMFLHRIETSFFDHRLQIGLSEAMMVGDIFPDLKFYNPMIIWHDLYDWTHASSFFGADISINPWKYVTLYGQYVFNQIQTYYELTQYATDAQAMPSAQGFMAGAMADIPLGEGYLGFGAEFFYADPWLYIRETAHTSYEARRRYLSNITGGGKIEVIGQPIGNRYGPDSISLYVRAGYEIPDIWGASLECTYVAQGEQNFNNHSTTHTGFAAISLKSPSGVAEKTLCVALSGWWQPFDWMRVGASMATYSIDNTGHASGVHTFDFQPSIGVQFMLGRKTEVNR